MLYRHKKELLRGLSIFLIVAFVIYFTTVYFFTLSVGPGPKIKLNRQEKEIVKLLEDDCNCDVQLLHNYQLIKNSESQKNFESIDSCFWIKFSNNSPVKQPSPFCDFSDSLLTEHAKKVAITSIQNIRYRDYYHYVGIIYQLEYKKDENIDHCFREVKFKLISTNNLQLIYVNNYNE